MYKIYVFGYTCLQYIVLVHLQVTFDSPPPEGATVTVAVDEVAGSGIYNLKAKDSSGHVPAFTIMSQKPSTPTFSIDANSESLVVPSQFHNVGTAAMFNLTFRVMAGSSTATSGLLTVIVTDANNTDLKFINTSYTGEVRETDPPKTTIVTVTANGPNQPITYCITESQTTFSVDSSGVISLVDSAGLTSQSSPIMLEVQAFDGRQTAFANVTILIDFCSPANPCSTGKCVSLRRGFSCPHDVMSRVVVISLVCLFCLSLVRILLHVCLSDHDEEDREQPGQHESRPLYGQSLLQGRGRPGQHERRPTNGQAFVQGRGRSGQHMSRQINGRSNLQRLPVWVRPLKGEKSACGSYPEH